MFLTNFPLIRLAQKSDSPGLIILMNESAMEGKGLKLSYQREPDFFKFLKYQGDQTFVFCLEQDKKLLGFASVTIRNSYINGAVKRLAYIGDLRMSKKHFNLQASKEWKKFMGAFAKECHRFEDARVDAIVTAIMHENLKAKKYLVDHPSNQFKYHFLQTFQMINIAAKPIGSKFKYIVRPLTERDKNQLLLFIDTQHQNKAFGHTLDNLTHALNEWDHFSIKNFIGCFHHNELIAVTALWNPSPAKKIIIRQLPWQLKLMNSVLAPFTSVSKENKELRVQYLTFLTLSESHPHALKDFITYFSQLGGFKDYTCLAFPHFQSTSLGHLLTGCIYQKTAIDLYGVTHKEYSFESVNPEKLNFEIALV